MGDRFFMTKYLMIITNGCFIFVQILYTLNLFISIGDILIYIPLMFDPPVFTFQYCFTTVPLASS